MNQWKNWLKSHYQYKYDLSQIRWSRLIPQKWRNRINQHSTVQKKKLNKWNLYEKDPLIQFEKKMIFILRQTHYQSKKIILKNTIDIIFYHINLLIMKIRRTHLFMDHHSK